ncbi:transcriptional regulator [Streptomyces sp. NK15101]|uniref:transcriptional regulator n=1 Tax=Streptomyces sp. NK15101 TaxID=2873261 RepID=UPI001CED0CCE|nr:transcriptional regulator [Streptomyces sp. NK15101]
MVGKITGEFGAHGKRGGEAISDRLTELAGGIKSSAMSERGLEARLNYLTKSPAGYQAMERAGIEVKPRTLIAWLSGDRDPNKANRSRIDAAYADLRRRNIARSLKKRLNNNGRGTRVEVHPITQSGVTPSRKRDLDVRKINVRPSQWDQLVDQWAAHDTAGMNDTWDAIAEDSIGSDWGAYTEVSSIGFGA